MRDGRQTAVDFQDTSAWKGDVGTSISWGYDIEKYRVILTPTVLDINIAQSLKQVPDN